MRFYLGTINGFDIYIWTTGKIDVMFRGKYVTALHRKRNSALDLVEVISPESPYFAG